LIETTALPLSHAAVCDIVTQWWRPTTSSGRSRAARFDRTSRWMWSGRVWRVASANSRPSQRATRGRPSTTTRSYCKYTFAISATHATFIADRCNGAAYAISCLSVCLSGTLIIIIIIIIYFLT